MAVVLGTGRLRGPVRLSFLKSLLHAAAALLCALGVLASSGAAFAQARFDFRATPGRLDKGVQPQRVQLSFDLDPAKAHFNGRAEIELLLDGPRASLLLHADRLNAGEARVIPATGPARVLRVVADEATQTWTLRPEDGAPLPAGTHRLVLSWQGPVQRVGQGLFVAQDHSGAMLGTQLQAVFARQVFPGFDEPAFRAPYGVEIRAPAALQALSNMPATSVVDEGATRLHRFAPTPPMPAYLLALAVGPFELLSGSVSMGSGPLPLRIVTMPGKRGLGAFALQATQQLMPYFEQRFGQPYTLPKLDQIAVPSTRFGAMEDWGLASYVESGLLFDPARSSVQRASGIYSLIAHELAHQWFGNLVTAASWEDIWLNEAFAVWLANEATDHFNPGWQLPLRRRAGLDNVLARDAGDATRAMRSGAVDEQQVFQVFDDITYAKGGAVLSMLQQWLGAEAFSRGLQAYMADRRLSSATAGDLWHHLGAAAGRDVRAVAASWTDQPGHPLVQVTQRCAGRGAQARTQLTLTQERFFLDAAGRAATRRMSGQRADDAPLWQVPVALARGDEQQVVLLSAARQQASLPGCDANRPWRANAGGLGFYRVRHDAAAQAQLAAGLAALPATDRLTLLSDTLALAQAGAMAFADWAALAQRVSLLPEADRAAPLQAVLDGWRWFVDAAGPGLLRDALQQQARAQLMPELQRLGLDPRGGEPVTDTALRNALLREGVRWGDEPLQAQARRRAVADLDGTAPLPRDTRQTWIEAAGVSADPALYTRLLEAALAATSQAERSMLLEALAANRDPALAARTLDLSLQSRLEPLEAFWLPGRVARASPHAALAYAHALAHFDALVGLVAGAGWGEREGLLPGIAGRLPRSEDVQALLADQARLVGEAGAVNARRAVQQMTLRQRWREREGAQVLGQWWAAQR
jgi:aminopeptidase N